LSLLPVRASRLVFNAARGREGRRWLGLVRLVLLESFYILLVGLATLDPPYVSQKITAHADA
jgi:hypothetical protein